MTEQVFFSIGSNLGDREAHLRAAISALEGVQGLCVLRVSKTIETAPWGNTDQPAFLNAVVEAETTLIPQALLAEIKVLENKLGRIPTYHWGPRVIDIDIVTYGRWRVETPDLIIPHRHAAERSFVMDPLRELAPEVAAAVLDGKWADRRWPGEHNA